MSNLRERGERLAITISRRFNDSMISFPIYASKSTDRTARTLPRDEGEISREADAIYREMTATFGSLLLPGEGRRAVRASDDQSDF